MIGCPEEAVTVLKLAVAATVDGVFRRELMSEPSGWQGFGGADRVVLYSPNSETVYKIDPDNTANEREHENMTVWRERDQLAWAPATSLYRADQSALHVLAMPYFPGGVASLGDEPADLDVLHVLDRNLSNYRRRSDGQVMLVDAGYVVPWTSRWPTERPIDVSSLW